MSEKMERIKACFPYPEARPGQLELIAEIIDALDGGAKNAIVDAPTGTGKTPIAITLAAYYTQKYDELIRQVRADYVRNTLPQGNSRKPTAKQLADAIAVAMKELAPHQAHMITSMKLLQAQYIDPHTSGLITLMKGKNNYLCNSDSVPPRTTCSEYESDYGEGRVCEMRGERGPCAYMAARLAAQLARLTLHNFDSFFAQVSLGGSFIGRRLLTIDEAHNAEAKVIDAVSFNLDKGKVLDYGAAWEIPNLNVDSQVKAWAVDITSKIEVAVEDYKSSISEINNKNTMLTKKDFADLRAFNVMKRDAEEMKRKIDRYVMTSDKPWVMEKSYDGDTVRFEPVKGSYFAKGALTGYGTSLVLLSATIIDKRRVMSGLNLKEDDTFYVAAPCLFPVSSRRIVDTQAVDTGKNAYERNVDAMCTEIKRIMDRHKGVRGVIHAASYQMARDIADRISDPRLMTHDSKGRGDTVQRFIKNSAQDAVLVGVMVKEGYDFKNEQCRFQIIPRIPYPYVTSRIAARDEIEPGYYQWLTCIDLMQEAGRGTRSAEDMCVTYVTDKRFGGFVRKYQHMMPQWFTEAIEIERLN